MRELDCIKLASDIQDWIKKFVGSAKAKGVVIGLSGGIDSATTAALCVNALGKESVIGLGMPVGSITQDLEDAKLIATHLGIKFMTIELTSVYKEFLDVLPKELEQKQLAIVNIKPRLRMTTVYFATQSLGGYLVAGTGNRTELAIGYFTKYGDGACDFESLGDLYKCEVKELARVLKIPEKIIVRIPSAGLWLNQTDEDEIGIKYDLLDEILYRIDHYLELDDLNPDDVQKVIKMIKNSEHKNKVPPMFDLSDM